MSSMLQRWFITPTGREQEKQGPKKFEDYTLKQVTCKCPEFLSLLPHKLEIFNTSSGPKDGGILQFGRFD